VHRLLIVVLGVAAHSTVARADRVVEPRELVRGDYLAPQFSPDGRELLMTGSQQRGLVVLADGRVRIITDDAEAGVHVRWHSDGSIVYRALRGAARLDLVIGRDRVSRAAAPVAPVAFTTDDRMYVVDRAGRVTKVGSGDRFFGPVVAPDGNHVVFQGLTTGLYLYVRSTGVTRYIGPGTAPAWSPDSTRLVYEVSEDDGHAIVASDLFLYTVATDRAEPITTTDRVIERRPSFAPNGRELAFDDNTGGIYVGRLEVQ
jgi:Tol biopolymer transport system component